MGQHIRQSFALLLIASSLLTACANHSPRSNLRHGLLVLDLKQRDFLKTWDFPTRTSALSGDEIIKSGIAGWGGFFFKGRDIYEVWEYEDRQTRLVFHKQKLVAWKTALPVQQLAVEQQEPGAVPPIVETAAVAPAQDIPTASSPEVAPQPPPVETPESK